MSLGQSSFGQADVTCTYMSAEGTKLISGRRAVYRSNGWHDGIGFLQSVSESESVQLSCDSSDDKQHNDPRGRHNSVRPILDNLQHDDSGDAVPKSRGDLQEGQQQSSVGESPGSDLDECSEPPSKHAKHDIVGIGIPDCVCVQKYRLRADAGSQQQPSRTN